MSDIVGGEIIVTGGIQQLNTFLLNKMFALFWIIVDFLTTYLVKLVIGLLLFLCTKWSDGWRIQHLSIRVK